MYIKTLSVLNFRGIPKLDMDDFGRINLILGKNNCAKTSVLEAIFMLVGASNPELVLRINNFRDMYSLDEEIFRLIFYDLDYNNAPILKAEFTDRQQSRTLAIEPNSSHKSRGRVQKISKDNVLDIGGYDTSFSENKINELIFNVDIKENHAPKKSFKSKISFEKGVFISTEDKTYKEKDRSVFVGGQVGLAVNLLKKLEQIVIQKKLSGIINVLKIVDKSIQNIVFGVDKTIYIDTGSSRLIPLNVMGDGIRRLLAIILAVSDAENGILLIDELENGLHYSTLVTLWKTIIKASDEYKVQLIISTHNKEVLMALDEALTDTYYERFQSCVRAYTLRKGKDGMKSYMYSFKEFDFALNQEVELR